MEYFGWVLAGCCALALLMYVGIDQSQRGRKKRPPEERKPRQNKTPSGDLLRPAAVSKLLGIPESTLSAMRRKGTGPAFTQDGKPVYYSREAIQDWLVKRTKAAAETPTPSLPLSGAPNA